MVQTQTIQTPINITLHNITTVNLEKITYVEYTKHAIGLGEIIIVIGGYITLAYFWILVNKNKEYYTNWKNPEGREVNVFLIIKRMMIWYPIVTIILSAIQIYLSLNLT